MSDIRNFFTPTRKAKPAEDEEVKGRRKPKPIISSDDDDDVVEDTPDVKKGRRAKGKNGATKKARKLSGSSDDDFSGKRLKKSSTAKNNAPDMKQIDPKDFFSANKRSPIKKEKKKENKTPPEKDDKQRKRKKPDVEFHDDADFAALLADMDENDMFTPSPSKRRKQSPKKSESVSSKLKGKVEAEKAKSPGEDEKKRDSPTKKEVKPDSVSLKLKGKVQAEKAKLKDEEKGASPSKDARSPCEKKKDSSKKPESVPSKLKGDAEERKGFVVNERKKEVKPTSPIKREPLVDPAPPTLLWVDKYKPSGLKSIIGQQGDKSNMNKLISWLKSWKNHHGPGTGKPPPRPPPWGASGDNGAWAKAALLSGPPGVGKTTTSYLVAKELGYEVTELNASDTRSKKALDTVVSDALNTRWVTNTAAKKILLMDEVDGMAGNEDRGGVGELIQLMKTSKIPIICMCNDRNHPKIRSLANYCFDLRFQKPRTEQIKAAMMSICFKEKVRITPDALNELIVGCNQDIRQVLHQLSMIQARENDAKMTGDEAKKEVQVSQKTSIKVGPWDVCRKVFSHSEHQNMTLMDKSDLFFHDYSLGPLFVQENYLSSSPKAAEKDRKKTMKLIANASDSFCDGDLVEKTIRSKGSWNLLPVQAMFSSVLPGEYMSGYLTGQINFPAWLGKYSRQNKFDRMLQEIQIHTRISANLSKMAVNREFSQSLREAIVRPMIDRGSDGVSEAVEVMNHYALLREDLDNLLELTSWEGSPDPMRGVESKVKAAFTRTYNKEAFLPYSTNIGAAKKAKVPVNDMGVDEHEADDGDDDEEDGDDVGSDAMIKVKKKPSSKAAAGRGKKAESAPKQATTKGKGRGKKVR